MWVRLKHCQRAGTPPLTHGGVVGEVWRGGARSSETSQVLAGIEVRPLDDDLGRAAGVLLGRSRQADAIGAAVVLLANDGDDIITSDSDVLGPMVEATGRHLELIRL